MIKPGYLCHPKKSKKKRVKNGSSSGNRKMAYNLGIYAVTTSLKEPLPRLIQNSEGLQFLKIIKSIIKQ
jgi:hypothetical protein